MPSISYAFDPASFDLAFACVLLSSDQTNALGFNESGQITMTISLPEGNARNKPGDGFDGNPELDQSISIIRLNNSVSRKVATDPDPNNQGVCIPTLLDEYWAYLEQQQNQEE